MQARSMSVFALLAVAATATSDSAAPIAKVIEMISDLEAKVIGEGDEAQKVYTEFSEWCEDTNKNLAFEIKTGKANVEELTATIEEETATIEELTAKIEDLGAAIAGAEGELKEATKIREKENSDFAAEEKELSTSIDMIERALEILEKEMGGASMIQLQNAGSVAQALEVMVKAAAFSAADASRLTALVQSSNEDEDGDAGAPAAKVYQGSSGKIIDTLQGLLDKGQAELDTLRKEETTAQNNYELLKQSLETDVKNNKADMEDAKKSMAEAGEKKSVAEGDLAVTSKNLAEDISANNKLHHDCMAKAEAFEEAVKEREEELSALAKAKKIIVEATSLAQTSSVSLLQMQSRTSLAMRLQSGDSQAVKFIRRLAIQQNSPALAQLANRMSSTFRFGAAAGEDPFAKVKGLIKDMIAKLEKDAEDDATQKAWCDKEMGETTEKKEDKDGEIEALTTKIDEANSQSAKLKEEVATLQKELAENAAEQKQMDEIRAKEKALYDKSHAETSKGLEGIQKALKVLEDYYAGKDSGAGEGIIGLLEVCESDFSKMKADLEATETAAVTEYENESKENEIEKTTKTKDVEYKTKEHTGLDKSVAEMSADREGVQEELDAVMEYFAKIKDKCIAKPETYEEQKKRREAEINGCKEALSILEGEAALLQKTSVRRTLRGLRVHGA